MKWLKSALIALLLVVVFAVSCKRDELSWDMDLTVPVAHASLSLDDLLADSITSINADGSVRVVYHTAIPGLNADSLFNIPDTTIDTAYHIPFGFLTRDPGDELLPTSPSQITYELAPAQLVYGILERGKMKVRMQNDIQKRVLVTYVLSSATFNNVPATFSYVVPAAPSATQGSILEAELDLANYEIDFTGLNGDRVNTLATVLSAVIDPTETGSVTLLPPDSVIISMTFEDVRPSYIRGYFGSEQVQFGPDESYLSFFSRVQSGQLGLDSVSMTFTLENYAGLDARFTVNNLWSRSTRTGQTVFLNHAMIGNPVNINRATYSFSYPPSIPQIYSWRFDNSNSNIVNLMEEMPDFLGYDFSIYTNPLGNVSGNNDFLYPRFGINAYLDVDIPVNFFADQIVLMDTLETDFGTLATGDIRKANLKLFAGNGFPFDAGVQIFMLDANNNVSSSIIVAPGTIYSAPLAFSNGYYFANGATQSIVDIALDEAQTTAFLNSTRLLVQSTFHTNTNPNYVKIFTTNRLDLNLTADFEYRVNN